MTVGGHFIGNEWQRVATAVFGFTGWHFLHVRKGYGHHGRPDHARWYE